MKIPGLLRLYSDYIRSTGMVRFEQPDQTVYVAPARKLLLRQQKAMELLRHLEVAPQPSPITRLRRFNAMAVRHQHLTDFMTVWQVQAREGRIEFIRRLGATVGMVHSLRHSGTGDILAPSATPAARYLAGMVRKTQIMNTLGDNPGRSDNSDLISEILDLWGDSGGTLVGNWLGFPPVKIWDSGLMVMDLSRAKYSEPLLDFVNIQPRVLGLDEIGFFWEYFLQGYGATCELPADWKQKIAILYKINLLEAEVAGKGEKGAEEDWQSKWWEKL